MFVAAIGVADSLLAAQSTPNAGVNRASPPLDALDGDKHALLAQKGRRDSHGACGRQPRQVLILGYVFGDTSRRVLMQST